MAVTDHVLNIEVGPYITKVIETDDKLRLFRTFSAFSFQTPEGTIENGELMQRPEEFRKILDSELRKRKIKTRKAVFVLQEAKFGSREEQLPAMKDNRLKEYIETNGRMFFPIQGENYHIIYRKNGPGKDGKERVQLFAIPEKLILTCEAVASFCGLQLIDVEISENGVAALLQMQEPKRTAFVVIVEETNMAITIISNGNVMMQRNVPYGVADAIESIQESGYAGEGLSFYETAERMKKKNCFLRADADSHDDYGSERSADAGELDETLPEEKKIKEAATKELSYVFGNITRMMEYYASNNAGAPIDVVYVGGLAVEIAGFKELLESELGTETVAIMPAYLQAAHDSKNLLQLDDRFDAVLAGSRRPVGVMSSMGKKRKGGGGQGTGSDQVKSARLLFIVCVAGGLALTLYPLLMRMQYNGRIDDLNAQIASLSEAREISEEYQRVLAEYTALTNLDLLANDAGELLPDFLEDMEKNLPSDATVRSLSAGEAGISVEFSANSRPVVEKTLQSFREFSSVVNPVVDALGVTEDENGAKTFTFTITCQYANTVLAEDGENTAVQEGISNYTDGTEAVEATEAEIAE